MSAGMYFDQLERTKGSAQKVHFLNSNANFHSDSALYPESGFQSDSGLSQSGTDSDLHPHSCPHPDSGF